MHSSGGVDMIELNPGRPISHRATGNTTAPVAFDTSGKTLAEWHHRKIRNTRAEKSAAGFFMSEEECDNCGKLVLLNRVNHFGIEMYAYAPTIPSNCSKCGGKADPGRVPINPAA